MRRHGYLRKQGQAFDMNNQGIDRVLEQVELVDHQIVQLLQVASDGIDNLLAGTLHGPHEIGLTVATMAPENSTEPTTAHNPPTS